jgi:hypothetical protein
VALHPFIQFGIFIIKIKRKMKNPKTTIFGLLGAIGTYLATNTTGKIQVIGSIVASVGAFLTGASAQDSK